MNKIEKVISYNTDTIQSIAAATQQQTANFQCITAEASALEDFAHKLKKSIGEFKLLG